MLKVVDRRRPGCAYARVQGRCDATDWRNWPVRKLQVGYNRKAPGRTESEKVVSKSHPAKLPPSPVTIENTIHAIEASVRQLIANGNVRTALENAKQFHKAQRTSASERLLTDTYAARIQSLLDQNLALEARSLLDLVRERFPSAKARLDALQMTASSGVGNLTALLSPLNEPELSRERRSAIEETVKNQITDLQAIADCPALLPEHPLRQAAAALDRAFTAVTTGPVTPEQIALPEVSHRSPLASWKLLIHAIARFYRGDDEGCLDHLAALRPESVAARLGPAMRAMLGAQELDAGKAEGKNRAQKPAELALIGRTTVSRMQLQKALVNLDQAFDEDESASRIFKAVRTAVRECQLVMPDQVMKLKQLITVRAGVEYMDTDRLTAALEGAARPDAVFYRMYARAMEGTGEPDDLAEACELWHEFGAQAVREGWFRAHSAEAATVYLHIAGLLRRIPSSMLFDLRDSYISGRESSRRKAWAEERYFLSPDELYRRACEMDPHPESFEQWMIWAAERSASAAEKVALDWNRARPKDIEPVLHLMHGAEKRSAIPTALSYLAKAERIDAVHSAVRAARLRLLAAGAMRHLQQNRPHLAKEKLAAITILPQSQQGDRPALLAALLHLTAVADQNPITIAETRMEVEHLLGGRIPAYLLIFGLGSISKSFNSDYLPLLNDLEREERKALPVSLARVIAIADDVGIRNFKLPSGYIDEAEKQFLGVRNALDSQQLRLLGELGAISERHRLAWEASQTGMERGGPGEARFLLLRARAMPPGFALRSVVVSAAAAELGRLYRDMEVVDRAVEIGRNRAGGDGLSLTIEDAREILRLEMASEVFPTRFEPGPDYSRYFRESLCDCQNCRRRRGGGTRLPADEGDDPDFEIEELEKSIKRQLPKGMPPDIADKFLEVLQEGFLAGETPEEVLPRIFGNAGERKHQGKSKGRRNT